MGALVTETPAASPDVALHHFQGMLAFETDCWDVHEGLKSAKPDFILVDVRGPASFANGHVPRSHQHPSRPDDRVTDARVPKEKLFVVYCAGPHCNGANKAALRVARLGLPVKVMIGGITGWLDEGFSPPPSRRVGQRTPIGSHR